LFTSPAALEHAKDLVTSYKQGKTQSMTPDLWSAKKVIDATLHPGRFPVFFHSCMTLLTRYQDTGEKVLLPFRMSAYIFSNLVVTAGMLTPGLSTAGTLGWQVANQSLNVAINSSNANKSIPLSTSTMVQSYFLAVGASCGVALGLNSIVPRLKSVSPNTKMLLGRLVPFAAVASAGVLNVFLMRGEEIRKGIDVFPTETEAQKLKREEAGQPLQSLGKSKKAATLAVGETAISRVINATPIMVLPPLLLVRLQKTEWLQQRPRMVTPVNLGLIFATSIFALPLALAIFPQRQAVKVDTLEAEFQGLAGDDGCVEFNRGI
jgi:tricarboxylate carrier